MNTRPDEIKIEAPNLLEALPNELGAAVMAHLVPNHRRVAQASSSLYSVFHSVDQRYWRDKFKRHFPHLYQAAMKKVDINWHEEFRAAEDKEYEDLSPRIRRLFYLVKEGDAAGLRACNVTHDDIFMSFDVSQDSIKVWAARVCHQGSLDYFYTVSKTNFLNPENAIVDVHQRDEFGLTVLNNAVTFRQHKNIIVGLIQQGCGVNIQENNGNTPIFNAAYFGWIELVEILLAHHADINLQNIDGATPLYAAAQQGNVDVVKCLLEHGADTDLARNFGDTPLFLASQENQIEIVKLLLTADKINLDASFRSNRLSLIDFAKDHSAEVQQRMLAFVDAKENPDDIRMRPEDIARVMGHEDIVKLIQQKREELHPLPRPNPAA